MAAGVAKLERSGPDHSWRSPWRRCARRRGSSRMATEPQGLTPIRVGCNSSVHMGVGGCSIAVVSICDTDRASHAMRSCRGCVLCAPVTSAGGDAVGGARG